MTDGTFRIGAPRDVPPPRPISAPEAAAPVEETGLGRAARAVAEAVAGLVGSTGGRSGDPSGAGGGAARSAVTGLRDVVGAVAGAVGAALSAVRDAPPSSAPAGGPSTGDAASGALTDLLTAAAPKLPSRDAARLRRAYPGASDEEIADALVARAARLTSGIGAGTGGLSAARWFAPASLMTLPITLGAETMLIAGVEVVLIGELHELYGRPATGDARARAAAYVASWSEQRPVDGAATAGLGALLSSAGMRALRMQLPRKLSGAIPTAAPFMLGAAVAGRVNRRATESLAERIRSELRGSQHGGPRS
ncbi:MAG: hypothetical protein ABWY29_07910 [Blastococcus sp.]